MPKVTFDGTTKIITVNSGITSLNVQTDLYSEWKEWVQLSDNSKYLPALRVVGGDEISSGYFLSGTYFLTNGWRVRPAEENRTLTITGNLFVDQSSDSPFVPTIGNYNVLINLSTSNIVNTVATGSGVTSQDKNDIINGVLNNMEISSADKDDIAERAKLLLDPDLRKILGLVHNNFKLTNQQYNADGNMTGANIYLYGSSSDCISGTSPIASYTIEATYNANKKLIDYKMYNN